MNIPHHPNNVKPELVAIALLGIIGFGLGFFWGTATTSPVLNGLYSGSLSALFGVVFLATLYLIPVLVIESALLYLKWRKVNFK